MQVHLDKNKVPKQVSKTTFATMLVEKHWQHQRGVISLSVIHGCVSGIKCNKPIRDTHSCPVPLKKEAVHLYLEDCYTSTVTFFFNTSTAVLVLFCVAYASFVTQIHRYERMELM